MTLPTMTLSLPNDGIDHFYEGHIQVAHVGFLYSK